MLDSADNCDVPSRRRFPAALIALLVALGVALVSTNHRFPAVDDECAIVDRAAQPVSYTVGLYLTGVGEHEHPPLYDLILHAWLRLTNGNMQLLRLPAIAFYLLGIGALMAAAKRLAGQRGQVSILVLVSLWPFGFHFGRAAAWYSFCFMLVSVLTWVYLLYLERSTLAMWTWVVFVALLLVYSNYFGWALLCFLAFDLLSRDPQNFITQGKRLLVGGFLLVLAYYPVLGASLGEIHRRVRAPESLLRVLLTGIYNLYCFFVSESVAPWFWVPGILAAVCISLVLAITLWQSPPSVKRFLIYFAGLFAIMTSLGIVETKRLLFIAPWLMLPLAVTLSVPARARWARNACLFSLVCIASIGWYGIFVRRLYAAPHWIEPWDQVANRAAATVRHGGVVIGNNPSFFFYLTYALRDRTDFPGLLPESLRYPGVYDPSQWLVEGQSLAPTVLVIEGAHFANPAGPTIETVRLLGAACTLTDTERLVYDEGAKWKRRFVPAVDQPDWRVMVSVYACPQKTGTQSVPDNPDPEWLPRPSSSRH